MPDRLYTNYEKSNYQCTQRDWVVFESYNFDCRTRKFPSSIYNKTVPVIPDFGLQ